MKQSIAKARGLTVLLIVANAGAVAILLDQALHGTQAARLLATAPKSFAAPHLDMKLPVGTVDGAVIQDQALFYAIRRLYIPPPPSALPVTPPRPDYKLAGTFIIPSKPSVALMRGAAAVSRKVRTGDDLDGWTVQAVAAGRVTLRFGAMTFDIVSAGRPAYPDRAGYTRRRNPYPGRHRTGSTRVTFRLSHS
jgi:hypothetical protein